MGALDDDQLVAAIAEARAAATAFGLTEAQLRMRFIMLAVMRLPRFWDDPTLRRLLTAPGATPEIRFGDVCALIKLGALREGAADKVWW